MRCTYKVVRLPPKATSLSTAAMSALCQKQTKCNAVKRSLFDDLVGEREQLGWNG
jgi:hypothetical protein